MVIKADSPEIAGVLPWEPPPFDEEPVLPPVETRWERGSYPWEEEDIDRPDSDQPPTQH